MTLILLYSLTVRMRNLYFLHVLKIHQDIVIIDRILRHVKRID